MSDLVPSLGVPRRVDDPVERDATTAPPGVVDAHVHVFPSRVCEAIRRWFDANAWEIRYRFDAEQVDAFLAARGVERYLGLHYSHAPGMAESLNRFALDFAREHPRCIPCATVLPGEPGAERILDEALSAGARAVKLHCHVQCFSIDEPRLDPIFRAAEAHDALLVVHCGDAPALPGYECDIGALCTADALDRAMRRHPAAKVCVPHLGLGDVASHVALLDRHPNLHLDTAMALSGYFPIDRVTELLHTHWDRLLYGTDFPNLPYAWDRDLRAIERAGLDGAKRAAILGGNARRLLGLDTAP